MFGVLKGFNGGLSERMKEEAMLKRVHEVIQAFDNQWLANDYVILDDLIWVLADGDSRKRNTHKKVIQEAVTIDALAVWDSPIEKQYKLNASIRQTGHLPAQTLVLKKDFLVWWKQTNAVPLQQRFIDLATIAKTKTSETTSKLKPLQELIIKTLIVLEYDVMSLPVGNGKTTGAKADVWEEIGNKFRKKGSFLYHWKYLRENNHIGDKK